MSIIDKWAGKLASAAGKPEWIEKVIEAARKELPEGQGEEITAIRNAGIYALGKLDANKGKLAKMSERQLMAFLARISLGKFKTAAKVYAGTKPGSQWAQAHHDVATTGDATAQSKRDYDEAIKLAKEIGSTVAKTLLPLLLTVVV